MNEMIQHIVKDRKIPKELLDQHGIKYDPSLRVVECPIRNEYNEYVGRIDYNPFVKAGLAKYNKNLKQGTRPVLYNAENLRNVFFGKPIFLVEGLFDCLAAELCGHTAIGCLTADANARDFQLLSRYTDKIILAFDNDTAGFRATDKLMAKFGKQYKLLRFKLHGAKDMNDLLVTNPDELKRQLEEFIKSLGND